MFGYTVVWLVLCEAEILYFVMIDCWAVGESVIDGRGLFFILPQRAECCWLQELPSKAVFFSPFLSERGDQPAAVGNLHPVLRPVPHPQTGRDQEEADFTPR